MATATTQTASPKKGVIGDILNLTRLPLDEQSQEIAEQGVRQLLTELINQEPDTEIRVDKRFVEEKIAELDQKLSRQVDDILHHNTFQEMESTWRSLKFLVDRTDFNENIKIEILNVSQSDLLEDFQDAAEITESGLYKHVYTSEFGQFGGEPYGVIVADYSLTPSSADIELMQYLASVSAMTHAPFITDANESFLGLEDYSQLPQLKQLDAMFEGPQYIKWRAFRESEDARNVGLTLPKFMLRQTYGENIPVKSFDYQESISEKTDYLWGNAAFAYATRLTESFASYRWCPNIIGPQAGGTVPDLAIDVVEENGVSRVCGPVETQISDRNEYELSELGFIPLTLRKASDNAVFFSSNSVQKPKIFANDDEGKQAELNYRLGTQLPYMFIINRLAHYIKVLQRENLGSWKTRADLEGELNKWIRQYVADQENPSAATRSQRPLRKASITVSELETEAGWYQVSLEVTPHFKFMGANFTLSLSSLLERA